MIVDGRSMAEEIFTVLAREVSGLSEPPHLTIFTAHPSFETQKFLSLKKKKADMVGIPLSIVEFQDDVTTEEVVQSIGQSVGTTDGIIVQLPFPVHIDAEKVIAAVPQEYDVDNLSGQAKVLAPVAGACKEIADRHSVELEDARAVVVGQGRLVGQPVAKWLEAAGVNVTVVTKDTEDISAYTKDADIVALGAGVPGLLQPDMIKKGAAIYDAGTSEDNGKLTGDADPACAEKALLFTPVPGGIGPLTVAMIFKNLLTLSQK